MVDKIHIFNNENPINFFHPVYKYFIYESNVNINLNTFKDYILKIEKDVIENNKSDGDGDTGLGNNSLTSRHNSFNLFKLNKPLTNEIKKHHDIFLKKLNIPNFYSLYGKCWANVMRKGDIVKIHRHSGNNYTYLSGNICVDTKNTSTYYKNPFCNEVFKSKNILGKITIFPSWLEHYTDVASSLRITSSFDLTLKKDKNLCKISND
jgi:hypothetical protein